MRLEENPLPHTQRVHPLPFIDKGEGVTTNRKGAKS
jgi:hypothetical protein